MVVLPINSKRVCVTMYLSAVLLLGCCDSDKINQNINALSSSKAKDRNDAALALARCGSRASGAVRILGGLLYDENVGVQSAAAYALREIDTPEARRLIDEAVKRRAKH